MWIPPQGFRHAATLLLTSRLRALQETASSEELSQALIQLAEELVALADDTKLQPEGVDWLIQEYETAVDRAGGLEGAKTTGREILSAAGSRSLQIESRDLFLVYVPEDRLPIAAPLAIELTKRRVTVAFSDFEVASGDELLAAVKRGLLHHRSGVLLMTPDFERKRWDLDVSTAPRFRILKEFRGSSTADELATWVRNLSRSG